MKEALHPFSFGVAMLIAMLHWLTSPPDGTWLGLVLHFGLDAAVAGAMVLVAELASVGRSPLSFFSGRVPQDLHRPWLAVHGDVRDRERIHVLLSRIAAFAGACAAFEVGAQLEGSPRAVMAGVIGAFLAAQSAVLVLMRPRALRALEAALDGQRDALPAAQFEALQQLFT